MPYYAIGGVELAAEVGPRYGGGILRTHFLARPPEAKPAQTEWVSVAPYERPLSLGSTISAVREVRRQNPDVIVFSLWRSFFAFAAVRLLFPRKFVVTFLHNTKNNHRVNAFVTRLMVMFSDALFADSAATAVSRRAAGKRARPISMVLYGSSEESDQLQRPAAPLFVSWCRLNRQKRIHLALEFIAELKKRRPDVRYSIIGPDGGSLEFLQSETKRLGLTGEVEFVGAKDRAYIEEAAARSVFFLQLSSFEGQSLAVTEAMQLGLVPVVTAVGAIADYCDDGINAVYYSGTTETAERVDRLLDQPEKVRELAAAARSQFVSTKSYSQDMIEAVRELEPQLR